MITLSHIEQLEKAKTSGLSLEQVISEARKQLELEEAREVLCHSIFSLHEYAQAKIREGIYDELINGSITDLIDAIQKDFLTTTTYAPDNTNSDSTDYGDSTIA